MSAKRAAVRTLLRFLPGRSLRRHLPAGRRVRSDGSARSEGIVDRSFKRFLACMLLTVAIYGGFVWGRTLGAQIRRLPRLGSHSLSHLLSANAGGAMGDMDYTAQDSAAGVAPSEIYETVLDHVQRDFVEGSA